MATATQAQETPVPAQEKLDKLLDKISHYKIWPSGNEAADIFESIVIELKIQRQLIGDLRLDLEHEKTLQATRPKTEVRARSIPLEGVDIPSFKKGDRVRHKANDQSASGTIETISGRRVQVRYGNNVRKWFKEDELVWVERKEA